MPRGLPHGVYDHLLTRALARGAQEVEAPGQASCDELGVADVAAALGRHVGAELTRLLSSLPSEGRLEHALAATNRLLESLPRLFDGANIRFARRVVGWRSSDRNETELVHTVLDGALSSRKPRPGLIPHFGGGSPNASAECLQAL